MVEALARHADVATDPARRFGARGLTRHAMRHQLVGARVEMKRDLVVDVFDGQVGAMEREAEEPAHARTNPARPAHHR